VHQKALLSITIPTWNRAKYLALSLSQLTRELAHLSDRSEIEILVSDNASDDDTQGVVQAAIAGGLPVRYVRNASNIGSDHNIAQCFNLASGDYVMLLGDDDLFVDDALGPILEVLRAREVGVVNLRAYGYEHDPRMEFPGGSVPVASITQDTQGFIVRMGVMSTLISANIVAKHLLQGVDAREFCGTSLVQTHLVYRAALAARSNASFDQYMVACKRNNSGGYAFSEVFVDRFGEVLDSLLARGVTEYTIRRLEGRMLLGYYPFYAWRIRRAVSSDSHGTWDRFRQRFGSRWQFWIFVAPTLKLPRMLGLVWGALATALGRTMSGELMRGLHFVRNRIRARNVRPSGANV
jgi:abequosyltransferase